MGVLSQLATRQRSAGRASVIKGGCKCQSFSAQTKVWGGPCPWALPHSRSTVGRWETGGAQEGKAGFTQGQTGAGRWFVTTFSIILSVK